MAPPQLHHHHYGCQLTNPGPPRCRPPCGPPVGPPPLPFQCRQALRHAPQADALLCEDEVVGRAPGPPPRMRLKLAAAHYLPGSTRPAPCTQRNNTLCCCTDRLANLGGKIQTNRWGAGHRHAPSWHHQPLYTTHIVKVIGTPRRMLATGACGCDHHHPQADSRTTRHDDMPTSTSCCAMTTSWPTREVQNPSRLCRSCLHLPTHGHPRPAAALPAAVRSRNQIPRTLIPKTLIPEPAQHPVTYASPPPPTWLQQSQRMPETPVRG